MQNTGEASVDEMVSSFANLNVLQHAQRKQPPAQEEASKPPKARVLTLGEGNGTFALSPSMAKVLKKYAQIDDYTLSVTDNIPEHEWKASHPGIHERLVARGFLVKFGVDARNTDMVKDKELIMFILPYVADANGRRKQATVELIRATMRNIVRKANCGTRVWIALATPKDNTFQTRRSLQYGLAVPAIIDLICDDSKRIPGCDQCLSYEGELGFLLDEMEGYEHMRTSTRKPFPWIWLNNKKEGHCLKVVKRMEDGLVCQERL